MLDDFQSLLQGPAADFWRDATARASSNPNKSIPEILPALGRRIGRSVIGGGVTEIAAKSGRPARVDLDVWRRCDAAGYRLLATHPLGDDALVDLYLHGDLEERLILLRALSALPVTGATIRLVEEVQRTNMESHFRAAVSGSNLAIRAREDASFDQDGFNRLILKAAFIGVPLDEILDAEDGANPELSRMLQDLATEREAAGRAIWPDTARMIAAAPCDGTLARVIGGLEHGDDRLRLSAAQAVARLKRDDLTPFVRERIAREPRAEIRAALEQCL